MIRPVLIAATAALIGGAATAGAQTAHIFGHGGKTYQFGDTCRRETVLPPGITDHQALNFLGQQVTCLVKRENRMKNCYLRVTLEAKFDHGPGKPGDWANVDDLQACGSL